jgi:lipoate-protein ligase A
VLFETIDFIDDPVPRDAAMNMALDEALLSHLRAPTLRVYRWLRPSVSFGYFEKWKTVEPTLASREAVRRWTGGGIVPHGDDFTYTLLVPADSSFLKYGARDSYCVIHERVAAALIGCGVPASITGGAEDVVSRACFEKAVAHDVMLDTKKIAGAAQRRTRDGLLHQGSVQGVLLPEDFAARLAMAVSNQFVSKAISDEFMSEAVNLRLKKYATDAWLRKF